MKKTALIQPLLPIAFSMLLLIVFACKKKELPKVTTAEVSSITAVSAEGGGEITSDGGSAIIARGVCWSTKRQPTIEDEKTNDGSGIGTFTSSINRLSPNTLYYVRAYATNENGTSYGYQVQFRTSGIQQDLTVNILPIDSITPISVYAEGSVSSENGNDVIERGFCWSTSPNPDINDQKTIDGEGTGSFSTTISGLDSYTQYYIRAYATNEKGVSYSQQLSFTTLQNSGGTVTDIDGNIYKTVTIGTQEWMAENLRTTRYNDGTPISAVSDSLEWSGLNIPAYAVYDNQPINEIAYGLLYNWFALASPGLCPEGWHIPIDTEWQLLIYYLGGENVAGGKLKDTGTSYWQSPNTDANNETGFSARAGGFRASNSDFYSMGINGYWWTANAHATDGAWYYQMNNMSGAINGNYANKKSGFSVRCLKN